MRRGRGRLCRANQLLTQLVQLKREADEVVVAIPELKAHCAGFQKEITAVVAKHGDIQFVFEHYLQVRALISSGWRVVSLIQRLLCVL